jgi:hypothetical protein
MKSGWFERPKAFAVLYVSENARGRWWNGRERRVRLRETLAPNSGLDLPKKYSGADVPDADFRWREVVPDVVDTG